MRFTISKYWLSVVFFLIASTNARTDLVHDWNNALINLHKLHQTAAPTASREFALLHVAIFDAINGISHEYEPYLIKRSPRLAEASPIAAGSSAAHRVLQDLYSDDASVAIINELNQQILSEVPRSQAKARGIIWGEYVAQQLLVFRENDGNDAVVLAPSNTGPGAWIPTLPDFSPYLLPQWGFVTPFTLTNGSQFRPAGPPQLFSSRWARDFNQVKELGSKVSTTRTNDQTLSAIFWGKDTKTPAAQWNDIAQTISLDEENSLIENARLFALLNLALADAAIGAWDAKYHYDFWRPITAIRAGNTDGNPLTGLDNQWLPLLDTPPFPEYVSGHSAFGAAAATTLALFYGTDEIAFTADSDALPGLLRHFSKLSSAARDAGLSRLYGGVHFLSSIEDGLTVGTSIGAWAFSRFLRPQ